MKLPSPAQMLEAIAAGGRPWSAHRWPLESMAFWAPHGSGALLVKLWTKRREEREVGLNIGLLTVAGDVIVAAPPFPGYRGWDRKLGAWIGKPPSNEELSAFVDRIQSVLASLWAHLEANGNGARQR